MGPALGIISLVLGVGGSLMSYSAQTSAANTQATFSALNAAAGAQEATQSAQLAALQNTLQATTAQTAAESAANNAEAMRAQAEMDAKIAQENIRRGRDEFQRQLAAATAQQGGSGAVVATGSPLDFLINAADLEQQEAETAGYVANAERSGGYRRAAGEALGGKVQGMNSSLYTLESLSSIQKGRMGAAAARLEGYAGAAKAAGMRSSALGGLISGFAGSATSWAARKY